MTPPIYEMRYTESHEWAKPVNGDVLVGITAFAVKELQDLVFITLPKPGAKAERGKRFGEIESVKAVVDLFSPVDGVIVGVNEALERDLELLAKDPYGEGWMIRVKPAAATPADALAGLMDEEAYAKHTASQHH
jgi:glycine cleavage system H protein